MQLLSRGTVQSLPQACMTGICVSSCCLNGKVKHAQKCEDDVERLPGEIEAHQARVAQLTEELAGAEAEVERLAEAARPERETLTRKQQVGVDSALASVWYCCHPSVACITELHRKGP